MDGFKRGMRRVSDSLERSVKKFGEVVESSAQETAGRLGLATIDEAHATASLASPAARRAERRKRSQLSGALSLVREDRELFQVLSCSSQNEEQGPSGPTADGLTAILDCLPQDAWDLEDDQMDRVEERLEYVLDYVSVQLARKVADSHEDFVQGLEQVHDLEADLQLTAFVVKNARRQIGQGERELLRGGLGVIQNFKKKQMAVEVVSIIRAMKQLVVGAEQVQAMLAQCRFGEATAAVQELESSIEIVRGVECMQTTISLLQQVENRLGQQIWSSLKVLVIGKDTETFQRVLEALVRKGEDSVEEFGDKLPRIAEAELRGRISSIVQNEAIAQGVNKRDVGTMSIAALTAKLSKSRLESCFLKVFDCSMDCLLALVEYKSVALRMPTRGEYLSACVHTALQECWSRLVYLIGEMIGSARTSGLELERFLNFVHMIAMFTDAGEFLVGMDAHELRGSMRNQSIAYLKSFHQDRVDLIINMMESESWQRFPVGPHFGVRSVPDILPYTGKEAAQPFATTAAAEGDTEKNPFKSYVPIHLDGLNALPEDDGNESDDGAIFDPDDDDEESSELRRAYINEDDPDAEVSLISGRKSSMDAKVPPGPVLVNVALSLTKFIGQYLGIMQVLSPVASDVFKSLAELFQLYLFAVINLFTPPSESSNVRQAIGTGILILEGDSSKFSAVFAAALRKMREKFLPMKEGRSSQGLGGLLAESAAGGHRPIRVPDIKLSEMVDLTSTSTFFGLQERLMALESTSFLSQVMKAVQPSLLSLIPEKSHADVFQFFSQFVDGTAEVRSVVVDRLPILVVPLDTMMAGISKVKWDTKELAEMHNDYVDHAVSSVAQLVQHCQTSDEVPEGLRIKLLCAAVVHVFENLVQAYAKVKKYSHEGRALLSHDLSTLSRQLEVTTGVKPLPHFRFADEFVRAFYVPEDEFASWVAQHPEYDPKVVLNLLHTGCGSSMKRKALKELQSEVENILREHGYTVEERSSLQTLL